MKIYLTPSANRDLRGVENYIRQDNPAAADFVEQRIFSVIDYLLSFPAMGRLGRIPNTRELVISGTPFIVKYHIRQERIVVLRVLHASRKWM